MIFLGIRSLSAGDTGFESLSLFEENLFTLHFHDSLREWIENEKKQGNLIRALKDFHLQDDLVFMDQEYKSQIVLKEIIDATSLYMFYRLVTDVEKSLATNELDKLYQLQRDKAFDRFRAWYYFGENVVDFSSNCLPKFMGKNTIQELEQIYGKSDLQYCMNLSTQKMYIDRFRVIEELKKDEGGRCYGISFDFIASYFEKKAEDPTLSDLEIIKKIAPRFRNGASNRAELGQIIQNLVRFKPDQLITSNDEDWYVDFDYDWIKEKDKLISQVFNLKIKSFISSEKNPSPDALEELFYNLPKGVYLITCLFKNSSHSIAFINTYNGQNYIFDPNFAILHINSDKTMDIFKQLERIWSSWQWGELEGVFIAGCEPN